MALILDLPASVDRELAVNSVSSNLSPQERHDKDRAGYKKEYQDALFNDAEQKKTQCIALDNGRSRTNADECIGMPLHSDVFMQRLMQLNPSFWFEQSHADPEKMGIYLQVPISLEYIEGKQFLFGFHIGIMPEFTLQRDPGEDGENVGILRQGYRTILMRLVQRRLISLSQVEVMFGPPSRESAYWAVLTGKRSSIQ